MRYAHNAGMRSWCALALTLLATVAQADPTEDPMDAYAPVELVGIMIDSGQCLLWHEGAREYRVGKIGQEIDGWKIVAIEEDRVVLTQGTERDELALPTATTTIRPSTPTKAKLPVMIVGQEA